MTAATPKWLSLMIIGNCLKSSNKVLVAEKPNTAVSG